MTSLIPPSSLLEYLGNDAAHLLHADIENQSVNSSSFTSQSSSLSLLAAQASNHMYIGVSRSVGRKRFRRPWRRGQLRHTGLLTRLIPLMASCHPSLSHLLTKNLHIPFRSCQAVPAIRRHSRIVKASRKQDPGASEMIVLATANASNFKRV